MLTFSKALALFTILLTIIYFILLIISEKVPKHDILWHPHKKINYILTIMITTIILLQNIPSFRFTLWFLISFLFISTILLYSIVFRPINRDGSIGFILSSAILYHLLIVYWPPVGIYIFEATPVTAKIVLNGHYNPAWKLVDPSYNPFPLGNSLYSTISIITTIPVIKALNLWIVNAIFLVAYDLILYSLVKHLIGKKFISVLVIFVLAITPPLYILGHLPQWGANMLILMSTLALIKALKRGSMSYLFIAFISYMTAIFFHASAILAIFLLIGIIVYHSISLRFFNYANSTSIKTKILYLAFLLFIISTFIRAAYTEGYLEYILPNLNALANSIYSYIVPMSVLKASQQRWIPLYDRTVNPIQAFPWALLAAMATALILITLLRKKMFNSRYGMITIFYIVGAIFLLIGFLTATSGSASASNLWRSMYPAYTFLLPASVMTGMKILKTQSRFLMTILTVLLIISATIAINDPQFLKGGPLNLKGERPATDDVYIEVNTIFLFLPRVYQYNLVSPYSISTSLHYLSQVYEKPVPNAVGKLEYTELKEKMDMGVIEKGFMYMLAPNVKFSLINRKINVFYDSGVYILFMKT